MKKLRNILIVLGVLFLFIGVPILSGNSSIFKNVSYGDFKELLNSEEFTMVYIGSPNCSHCNNMKPSLKKLYDEVGVKINYLNSEKLSKDQINEIAALDEGLAKFGTPTFIYIKDGEMVGYKMGEVAYDEFKELYDTYSRYEDTTVYYKEISVSTYLKKYESKDVTVLVVGLSSCENCTNYKKVMNKVARKYDATINYIEYDSLTKKNKTKLKDINKKFETFTTPYTVISKDGKIIEEIIGYVDEASLVETLVAHKVIELSKNN